MCDKCRTLADQVEECPPFEARTDGPEITVHDDGNRDIVLDALQMYADAYLDRCEILSALATPVNSVTHMVNAINTTERICAMVASLSTDDTATAGTETK